MVKETEHFQKINQQYKIIDSIFNQDVESEEQLKQIMKPLKNYSRMKTTCFKDTLKPTVMPVNDDINTVFDFYANSDNINLDMEIPIMNYEAYYTELLKYSKIQRNITSHLTRYFNHLKNGYITTSVVILDKFKENPVIVSEVIFRDKILSSKEFNLYNILNRLQTQQKVIGKL